VLICVVLVTSACRPSKGATGSIEGHASAILGGHGYNFVPIPVGTEAILKSADGKRVASAKLGPDGRFEFHDVAVGTYTVAFTPTYTPTEETLTVEVHAGGVASPAIMLTVPAPPGYVIPEMPQPRPSPAESRGSGSDQVR